MRIRKWARSPVVTVPLLGCAATAAVLTATGVGLPGDTAVTASATSQTDGTGAPGPGMAAPAMAGMAGMAGMARPAAPGMAMPAAPGTAMPAAPDQPHGDAPVATNTVSIQNFAFAPGTATVKAGTTVTWTNQDQDPHTVTSMNGGPLQSPPLTNGQSFRFTFTKPGRFDYLCTIHPFMTGTVVVTP
jgi:plastocyanin